MKEIFPSNKSEASCLNPQEKPITEQQYEDLVRRTNTAVSCAEAASGKVDNLQDSLATQVSTNQLCATNANVDGTLCAGSAVTAPRGVYSQLNTNCLDVSGTGCFRGICVRAVASIRCAIINNSCHQCITADNGTINTLQSSNATIENAEVNNLQVNGTMSFNCADVDEVKADTGCIDTLHTTNASFDTTFADKANSNTSNVNELNAQATNSTVVDTNYITHKNDPQEINGGTIEDHYILLPQFTNGNYFLEARNDGGVKLWSVEFTNSINNIQMRWSQSRLHQIVDLKYAKDASGVVVVQLHVKADEHLSLFRQSQSTDNTLPPSIYTVDQLPSYDEIFEVTEYKGTFIQDIIFTNKLNVKELQMDSLILKCGGFTKELLLTCGYDNDGCPIPIKGEANQYVTNKDKGCGPVPAWNTPAEVVSCTCEDLITSRGVAAYNGETEEGDYPITHLGDTSCVHGSLTVGTNLKVNCDFKTNHISDEETPSTPLVNDSLVFNPKLNRYRDGCFNELTAWKDNNRTDNRPVVYDAATDTVKTTCNLTVECANVGEITADTITTTGDVDIAGDLYVRGTTHTVEEETLSTGSDTIVLRQNNSTSLANGELAGIIVNKYNGTCNLAIGTGCDGQLRIGHPAGTSTSYGTVYFKDDVWYDTDKTTVITPSGELTSYDSKSIDEDGFTKYTNAIFTIFDYTALQPVMTREEESNITNNALLKFNRNTHRAEDIAIPTTSEQSLTSEVDSVTGEVSYRWVDKQAGVYCFATMADYNAYTGNIPIGSQVIIAECNNYLSSEVME